MVFRSKLSIILEAEKNFEDIKIATAANMKKRKFNISRFPNAVRKPGIITKIETERLANIGRIEGGEYEISSE